MEILDETNNMKSTCELKLPLAVGNIWTTDGLNKYEALAVERIKVPAGTYDAFRVEHKYDDPEHLRKGTKWYADGVGVVKEMEETAGGPVTWELVKFTPGKD